MSTPYNKQGFMTYITRYKRNPLCDVRIARTYQQAWWGTRAQRDCTPLSSTRWYHRYAELYKSAEPNTLLPPYTPKTMKINTQLQSVIIHGHSFEERQLIYGENSWLKCTLLCSKSRFKAQLDRAISYVLKALLLTAKSLLIHKWIETCCAVLPYK